LPLDGSFLTPPASINGNILAQIARRISNFAWCVNIDTRKNKILAIASEIETEHTHLLPRHFSQNPELLAWILFRERDPKKRGSWATYYNRYSRNIWEWDLIETIPDYAYDNSFKQLSLNNRLKQLAEAFGVPQEKITYCCPKTTE
jgi:hypothetical protein